MAFNHAGTRGKKRAESNWNAATASGQPGDSYGKAPAHSQGYLLSGPPLFPVHKHSETSSVLSGDCFGHKEQEST